MLIYSTALHAKDYYVNPSNGKDSAAGSIGSPWKTLAGVFKSGKKFQGGDTINLYRGYHGAVFIKGKNSKDVYIRPMPGHSPAVRLINMQDASHWHLSGLTISKATTPQNHPDMKVRGAGIWIDHMDRKNSSHITIEKCSLYTVQNSENFTRHDWGNRKAAIIVFGEHNKFKGNHLYNGGGIQIGWGSHNSYVGYNVIENVGSDACGLRGSNSIVEHNLFMNSYKANGNHNDLFQGWGSTNVIVRNNEFRAYTDPNQKFINLKQQSGGASQTQGMGLFDGPFRKWTIENNLIRVDHAAGIYISGARECVIRNNKVVRCGKKVWNKRKKSMPGIRVGPSKSNAPAQDNIITNNEAEHYRFELNPKKKNIPVGITENNRISATYKPPVDNAAPSKPTNLKVVTIGGYGSDLSWSPSTDNKKVMGYLIYHNGVKIGKVRTWTRFLAVGRQGGKFAVQAFDYRGNKSTLSDGTTNGGTVNHPEPTPDPEIDNPPPPPPGSGGSSSNNNSNATGAHQLSATRTGPTTIELSWNAPSNVAIKAYNIVCGTSNKNWKRIKTVNGQTTKTTLNSSDGIKTGVVLLQVRAVTTNGTKLEMSEQIRVAVYRKNSSSSSESSTPPEPQTPPPPPPPGKPTSNGAHSLQAERTGKTTIQLSWSAPAGVALKEYGVVLGANNKSWVRVATVKPQATSITLTSKHGIKVGTALLQVRAIRKDGKKLDMSPQLSVKPMAEASNPISIDSTEPTPDPVIVPAVNNGIATSRKFTLQAEHAVVSGAKKSGDYVDYINAKNDYIEWAVVSDKYQVARLEFRYALSSGDRPLEIKVNGIIIAAKLNFPKTGGWTSIKSVTLNVPLKTGINTIRATATGKSGGNIDALVVHLP